MAAATPNPNPNAMHTRTLQGGARPFGSGNLTARLRELPPALASGPPLFFVPLDVFEHSGSDAPDLITLLFTAPSRVYLLLPSLLREPRCAHGACMHARACACVPARPCRPPHGRAGEPPAQHSTAIATGRATLPLGGTRAETSAGAVPCRAVPWIKA